MNLTELCNKINSCLKNNARVAVTYLPTKATTLDDVDFTLFDPSNEVNSCGVLRAVLQSAYIYDRRKDSYGVELLDYDSYDELSELLRNTEIVLEVGNVVVDDRIEAEDTSQVIELRDDIHYRVMFDFLSKQYSFYFINKDLADGFVTAIMQLNDELFDGVSVNDIDFSQTFHLVSEEESTIIRPLYEVEFDYRAYEFSCNPNAFNFHCLQKMMYKYQRFVYPDYD